MIRVMFLRVRIASAEEIGKQLAHYYANGWRVVAHGVDSEEYTFVLEIAKGKALTDD